VIVASEEIEESDDFDISDRFDRFADSFFFAIEEVCGIEGMFVAFCRVDEFDGCAIAEDDCDVTA
jgi:hypothetical protein